MGRSLKRSCRKNTIIVPTYVGELGWIFMKVEYIRILSLIQGSQGVLNYREIAAGLSRTYYKEYPSVRGVNQCPFNNPRAVQKTLYSLKRRGFLTTETRERSIGWNGHSHEIVWSLSQNSRAILARYGSWRRFALACDVRKLQKIGEDLQRRGICVAIEIPETWEEIKDLWYYGQTRKEIWNHCRLSRRHHVC